MGLGNKTKEQNKILSLALLNALELGVQAFIFVAYSIIRDIFVRGITINK